MGTALGFAAFRYVLNAALYTLPLVKTAHAIRAILFALATIATLRGDRVEPIQPSVELVAFPFT